MVTPVIVVLDEARDLGFEIIRQVIVLERFLKEVKDVEAKYREEQSADYTSRQSFSSQCFWSFPAL